MKETIKTMAERLGVSTSTVSRVLSGKAAQSRISANTRRRVLAEAARCNYTSISIAHSLRTQKNNSIGILIPSLMNPYFAEMSSFIIQEARRKRYTSIVIDTMEDEKELREGIRQLTARQVDGIIAIPCGTDSSFLEAVSHEVPVILIDRYYEESTLPYVSTNNYAGGYEATSSLISMGHSNIVCIQGVLNSTPNNERVKGYKDAMKENGLEDYIKVVGNEFSIQNGYLETKLLLSDSCVPTAIFALSNNITLGAIKAIREAGLHIPDDISLFSYDNFSYMDYMEPPITRISQPVEDMSMLATKILFEQIEQIETRTSNQIKLSPSIITGKSTRILKNSEKNL